MLAGKTITQVTVGQGFACALDNSGAAYCWGANDAGTLGDGDTTNSSVPVALDTSGVLAGKTLTRIAAGYGQACALDTSGAAYCWGDNGLGDLGEREHNSLRCTGGCQQQRCPGRQDPHPDHGSDLPNLRPRQHGCRLLLGDNSGGDFGDGSTASSDVPVAVSTGGVLAGKILTQISAGLFHTCALDSAGAAYCWGFGLYGQLGDGNTSDSDVPVAVDTSGVLAGKTLTQITAGEYHTCALDTSGVASCWGDDGWGALGTACWAGYPASRSPWTPAACWLTGLSPRSRPMGAQMSARSTAEMLSTAGGTTTTANLGTATPARVTCQFSPDRRLQATLLQPQVRTPSRFRGRRPPIWMVAALLGTPPPRPRVATCSTPGSSATCIITGLTAGTTYTTTVVAHTTAGDSGESAPVSITLGSGIRFTSRPADTVTFDRYFAFIVTATGSPKSAITKTGKLPPGVHFRKGPKGVATISGTPKGRADGIYPLMLIAKNKSGRTMQSFTLTVDRAPGIMKIPQPQDSYRIGIDSAHYDHWFPVSPLTESGRLPKGLGFYRLRKRNGCDHWYSGRWHRWNLSDHSHCHQPVRCSPPVVHPESSSVPVSASIKPAIAGRIQLTRFARPNTSWIG